MTRLTLLVNHVLASEPVASQRLAAHAGRSISVQFEGWPALLPPLPATAFRVTPAGLVEWCGPVAPEPPDLRVAVDASNPALAAVQAVGGERPRIDVSGDAVFATDVSWVFDNLRWDVQDDLERLVGAPVARELARLGKAVAGAMAEAVRSLSALAARAGLPGSGPPRR